MLIDNNISNRLGIVNKRPNPNLSKYNYSFKRDNIRTENTLLKGTINDLVNFKRKTSSESVTSKIKSVASNIWQSLLKIVRVIKDFIVSVINKIKGTDRLIGKLAKSLEKASKNIEIPNDSAKVKVPGDWFKYLIDKSLEMKLEGMELDDIPRPIMELMQSIVENDAKIKVYKVDEEEDSFGDKRYKRGEEIKAAIKLLIDECEEKIDAINTDILTKSLTTYQNLAKEYDKVVNTETETGISLKEFKEKLMKNSKDIQKIYTHIIYTDFSIKNLNEMLFFIEKWAKRRVGVKSVLESNDMYDKKITEFANKCQNFSSKQLKKVSDVTKVTNTLINQCINYANSLLKIAKPYIKINKKEKKSNEKSK